MDLSQPLENIKGVGAKTVDSFKNAGLLTVGDLIYFLPRKHEDYSKICAVKDIRPGKVSLKVRVESIRTSRARRGLHITEATLADSTGKVAAVWFNQPYRADQLRKEKGEFFVSGEYALTGRKYQLTNPSVEKVGNTHVNAARIVPVYRKIAGLKPHIVRKVLTELKPLITMLPETLPEHLVSFTGSVLVKGENMVSHSQALLGMHFPGVSADIERARQRLGFEELFALILAGKLNKAENTKLTSWNIPFEEVKAKQFVAQLPFQLTNAQRVAMWQIIKDFEKPHPMNRLLQGDVGSGKTVVAGMAASLASHHGFQSALMAPTEILATQHAATLDKLLAPLGVRVGLLTGAVKSAPKKRLHQAIASGELDVIVGTHALIQEKVRFHKLGFVTIDEQHRFGVAQRQKLLEKSEHLPHLLSMTATPIPRSLALTVYGELDVSILNELPKDRKPIRTKIISPNSRNSMYQAVELEIDKGRQAYVVCPLIDDKPGNQPRSVEAEYKKLQKTVFSHRRIGVLHGQMSSDEKQAVMQSFSVGQIDILVSTTVIEVGVDVPNASSMIIENADQFGLATAHQLRGRVGRGAHQSYCYLVSSGSLKPTRRLRELERSQDGFYLADIDLSLRGPGEIYGHSQHGALNLQVASLTDTKLIATVQRAADQFMKSKDSLLHYKQLASQVKKYQRLTTLN